MLFEVLCGYFLASKIKDEVVGNPEGQRIVRENMIARSREERENREIFIKEASRTLCSSFVFGVTMGNTHIGINTPLGTLFAPLNVQRNYLSLTREEKIQMSKDFIARTGLTMNEMLLYVANTFGYNIPKDGARHLYRYNGKIYFELHKKTICPQRGNVFAESIFGKPIILTEICPEFILQRSFRVDKNYIENHMFASGCTKKQMWNIKKNHYKKECEHMFKKEIQEMDKYILRDAMIVDYVPKDGKTYRQWLNSLKDSEICEKFCGTPDWKDVVEHSEIVKIWEGK